MQQHLYCSQCKAGNRRVELDSYQNVREVLSHAANFQRRTWRLPQLLCLTLDALSLSHPAPQECLKAKELQCATFAPQLPGSFNSLDGPCTSCGSATVPVYATNEGSFQFAGWPRHPAALIFAATA
jgi:hypothetical protein